MSAEKVELMAKIERKTFLENKQTELHPQNDSEMSFVPREMTFHV